MGRLLVACIIEGGNAQSHCRVHRQALEHLKPRFLVDGDKDRKVISSPSPGYQEAWNHLLKGLLEKFVMVSVQLTPNLHLLRCSCCSMVGCGPDFEHIGLRMTASRCVLCWQGQLR